MDESSSSSSSTPVAFTVQLDNVNSAHPKLRINFPASFLDAPQTQSHKCEPNLLIRLPPGLFVDPFTFPVANKAPLQQIQPHRQDSSQHFNVDHSTVSSSSSQKKRPPHALLQDREVIKGIQFLNASANQGEILHHDFTKVELEKGLGYTIPAKERSLLGRDDGQHENLLKREYTAFVISLYRAKVQNFIGSEDQTDVEPQGQQIDIDVPLHTRYPIPTGIPLTDLDQLKTFDWQSLTESFIWPRKGNYHIALLEYPQAFWQCQGEGLLAVDSGVYESKSEADLLAPMHNHLTLPSSTNSDHFYLLLPPFRTSKEPFRIQIPVGRAELTIATQIITIASLLLASLAIIIRTSTSSQKVRKSERSLQNTNKKLIDI